MDVQAPVEISPGARRDSVGRAEGADASPAHAVTRRSAAVLALLGAGAAALWFLPIGIDPPAQHALAIGLFMIAAWMVPVLDHGVTGIIGCFLFWMLGVAKFETAFSGFADTT